MIILHPFQQAVVDQIEKEIEQGRRKLLLVAPTGSGKTVMGSAIINGAVERHHSVLVIAHRREIITQTRDKLVANGAKPGIVLAGFEDELRPYASIQVAAIQTLHARAIRSNRPFRPSSSRKGGRVKARIRRPRKTLPRIFRSIAMIPIRPMIGARPS